MINNNKKFIILNIASVLTLLVVVFPLLLIAQYNYPSADDWSFGVRGYEAIKSGNGFLQVLQGAFVTVCDQYLNWEGRFSAVLFASLQPGIWGEKYYSIVAYLMIGMLTFSEITLCWNLLKFDRGRRNGWYVLPTIVPVLVMQILYSPAPEESFYWYTGSVNYTFMYGLSLLLIALFIKLAAQQYSIGKYIFLAILSCILAVLVGGNNFATSLSCFLALFAMSILFLVVRRKAFYKTWFITLFMGVSLMLCIFAPGNMNRLNGNFGGETTGSAVKAVLMSLVRSATNIYSWTNTRVLLMLLFILPFVWMAVKKIDFGFRYPALFTLLTFGLYASQITATMYVDGTTGGGRMAAILYYSYMIWLVGNVFYWAGWLNRGTSKLRLLLDKAGGVYREVSDRVLWYYWHYTDSGHLHV